MDEFETTAVIGKEINLEERLGVIEKVIKDNSTEQGTTLVLLASDTGDAMAETIRMASASQAAGRSTQAEFDDVYSNSTNSYHGTLLLVPAQGGIRYDPVENMAVISGARILTYSVKYDKTSRKDRQMITISDTTANGPLFLKAKEFIAATTKGEDSLTTQLYIGETAVRKYLRGSGIEQKNYDRLLAQIKKIDE